VSECGNERIYNDLRPRGAGRHYEFNMYVLESKFEYTILRILSIRADDFAS
jgi:hypothetical protein